MLEKLTDEQKELMVVVKDEYINKFNTHKNIDYETCKDFIEWLYTLSKLKIPKVVIVDSPLSAQLHANNFTDYTDINNIKVTKKLKWYNFASYGNYTDYGWIAYYDFFTRIGVINNELFNKFKTFVDIGIYDMIQLDEMCIVSKLPTSIKKRDNLLHSATTPAVEFADGFKLWYWGGIKVPQQLIEKSETITKQDILSINNAELRKCYMEKLTAKVYYDIITDGKGLDMLDSSFDEQGNIMRLYQTKNNDDILGEKIQFLECRCPSTQDVYNIYPPSQKCKTAIEAKYDTFDKKKIYARQGDVGVFMESYQPNITDIET